jgi:hypothetical protein
MWHRQAAALALAADRVGVGADRLPAIQERLAAQRAALTAAAGATPPDLIPTATEVSAAMPALGDLSADAVGSALRVLVETLDAADAALDPRTAATAAPPPSPSQPSPTQPSPTQPSPTQPSPPSQVAPVRGTPKPPPPAPGVPPPWSAAPAPVPAPTDVTGWKPGPRNALVYGGYSVSVLVIQIVLLATLDEERTLPLLSPFCLLVLPAMAWLAGWLTIGAAFKPPPGQPAVKRTPRLGVVVCLLPNLALCALLGVLFIAR